MKQVQQIVAVATKAGLPIVAALDNMQGNTRQGQA